MLDVNIEHTINKRSKKKNMERDKQLTKRKSKDNKTNIHTPVVNTLTLLSCSKWTEQSEQLDPLAHECRNGTDNVANNNYMSRVS